MKDEMQVMKEINVCAIANILWEPGTKFIILWHPKNPNQFKHKIADIIPETSCGWFFSSGKLIPKIIYELEEAESKGWLYTLI